MLEDDLSRDCLVLNWSAHQYLCLLEDATNRLLWNTNFKNESSSGKHKYCRRIVFWQTQMRTNRFLANTNVDDESFLSRHICCWRRMSCVLSHSGIDASYRCFKAEWAVFLSPPGIDATSYRCFRAGRAVFCLLLWLMLHLTNISRSLCIDHQMQWMHRSPHGWSVVVCSVLRGVMQPPIDTSRSLWTDQLMKWSRRSSHLKMRSVPDRGLAIVSFLSFSHRFTICAGSNQTCYSNEA